MSGCTLTFTEPQGERLHLEKVDRVSKNSIYDDSRVINRGDACAKAGRENKVWIGRVRLIGRLNPDKHWCSVVLDVAGKEEGDCVIHLR